MYFLFTYFYTETQFHFNLSKSKRSGTITSYSLKTSHLILHKVLLLIIENQPINSRHVSLQTSVTTFIRFLSDWFFTSSTLTCQSVRTISSQSGHQHTYLNKNSIFNFIKIKRWCKNTVMMWWRREGIFGADLIYLKGKVKSECIVANTVLAILHVKNLHPSLKPTWTNKTKHPWYDFTSQYRLIDKFITTHYISLVAFRFWPLIDHLIYSIALKWCCFKYIQHPHPILGSF